MGKGKSIMSVHKKIDRKREIERITDIVVKEVQSTKVITEVSQGVKAIMLLALKKEGFGETRALRVLKEIENVEDNIIDNTITFDDCFNQVKVEYGDKVYQEIMKEIYLKEDNKNGKN